MHRTTIMLPEGLKKRMEKKAKQVNMSLGELVRASVESYLLRDSTSWKDDPLATDSFVIQDHSPADVSSNINKYLYGKKT